MKRIFFIHIPKTGGVSVEHNLLKETSKAVCPAYRWRDLYNLEGLDKYDLFMGHLQYFCKGIIGDAFTFTILRDPVERAMSAWEHINRSVQHPLNSRLSEAPTLKLALQHHALQRHLSNPMTRFLGWRPAFSEFTNVEMAIRSAIRSEADRAMLDDAKKCIDELDFIGFTETLSADMVSLFSALEVEQKTQEHLIRKNVNPSKQTLRYRDSLDIESLELLRAANELDYELYEYAKKMAGQHNHVC
ncbi:MAG: sulfotransferase family 2 domain-containing protein [Pseudomonadota bacterium]